MAHGVHVGVDRLLADDCDRRQLARKTLIAASGAGLRAWREIRCKKPRERSPNEAQSTPRSLPPHGGAWPVIAAEIAGEGAACLAAMRERGGPCLQSLLGRVMMPSINRANPIAFGSRETAKSAGRHVAARPDRH